MGNLHQGPQEVHIARLNKETKRYATMMMLILIPTIFTWLPLNIIWYTATPAMLLENRTIFIIYIILTQVLQANSFINPLVYAWINPRYRRGYFKILTLGKYKETSSSSAVAPAPMHNEGHF